MKKAVEELEKVIKDKSLEKTDFTPVIDILVAGVEEDEKKQKEIEKLQKENAELKTTNTNAEKEKEQLTKTIAEREKELADLKIKYVERFNNSDGKGGNDEPNKEEITIKELFEEVK